MIQLQELELVKCDTRRNMDKRTDRHGIEIITQIDKEHAHGNNTIKAWLDFEIQNLHEIDDKSVN